MTILKERDQEKKYHYLAYVEFLEFLCRVGIDIAYNENQKMPTDFDKAIFELLTKIWKHRETASPADLPPRLTKKGQEIPDEFPELIPLMEADQDEGK